MLGSAAIERVGGANGTLEMPWGFSAGGGLRGTLFVSATRALELQGSFEPRVLRGDAAPFDDIRTRTRAELRYKSRVYGDSLSFSFPWHIGLLAQGFHLADLGTVRANQVALTVGLGD